ncbi:hypothetical protein ACKP2L_07970 [Oenococcus alcoholitolerans]|uniref:hypothetical protein n=1 Tax=Oenococcus alcoholitolerans TaxID=931074 RepID=UPI003F6F3021
MKVKIDWQNKNRIFIFVASALFFYSVIFVNFDNVGRRFLCSALLMSQNSGSAITDFFSNFIRVYDNVLVQVSFRFLQVLIFWLFYKAVFTIIKRPKNKIYSFDFAADDIFLMKIIFINALASIFLSLITIIFSKQLLQISLIYYLLFFISIFGIKIFFVFLPYLHEKLPLTPLLLYVFSQILIFLGVLL